MLHSQFRNFRYAPCQGAFSVDETKPLFLNIWRQMVRVRHFEQELMKRYVPPHLTRCPIHYCVGQEAVPASVGAVRSSDDYLFCNHRNHGYYLSWLNEGETLLQELMGKDLAPNGGRAGSQEISNHEANFYSGAIVATGIGIATGTAFGIQLAADSDSIVFCCFGDGAADAGIFWEAVNMIALRQLPVLLICENNGYATFSPQQKRQARGIAERIKSFGIDTFETNSDAVMMTIKESALHVREKRAPLFIEHLTYRHCGHVGAHNDDINEYRDVKERFVWGLNDDLDVITNLMRTLELISPQDISDAAKDDAEHFSQMWDRVAALPDSEPLRYPDVTAAKTVKKQIAINDEQSESLYRHVVLNPY